MTPTELPDPSDPSVEFDLALHQMALNGDQSTALRTLWAQRRNARVHTLVDRLARAADAVAAPDSNIAIDKTA